jgi:hypothetical protein
MNEKPLIVGGTPRMSLMVGIKIFLHVKEHYQIGYQEILWNCQQSKNISRSLDPESTYPGYLQTIKQ